MGRECNLTCRSSTLTLTSRFRWVQCQLESLVAQKTAKAIKAALDDIPPTLEQTYCNILSRIPSQDRPLAKEAFLWLASSIIPLSFDELCEAVIIDESGSEIDQDARLLQPTDLLDICSNLISYDINRQDVVLAHSSVLTYLKSEQIKASEAHEFYIDPSSVANKLFRKCLFYLCSLAFESGYCRTLQKFQQRLKKWPFAAHCVHNLPVYARFITLDDPTRSLLMRFFETSAHPRGGYFAAWAQAYYTIATKSSHRLIGKLADFLFFAKGSIYSSPLYFAARFGLNSIVKLNLEVQGTKYLEIRGGRRGSTPLHVASAMGTTETVQTLLDAGADVHEINEMGDSGRKRAVQRGNEAIVRLLLSAGADADERDREGNTLLYYAIRINHVGCTLALLEAGASQSNVDGLGLCAADLAEIALHDKLGLIYIKEVLNHYAVS